MERLMATRFNNETWQQNIRWREKNDYSGCLYNTPVHIKDNIPLEITIYVIEMNNDKNKIMGIGKLKNYLVIDKKYKVYEERNYNRYTYKGKRRLSREDIPDDLLEKLEKRVFTTKRHIKRGHGIQQVTQDMSDEYLKIISNLFIK